MVYQSITLVLLITITLIKYDTCSLLHFIKHTFIRWDTRHQQSGPHGPPSLEH